MKIIIGLFICFLVVSCNNKNNSPEKAENKTTTTTEKVNPSAMDSGSSVIDPAAKENVSGVQFFSAPDGKNYEITLMDPSPEELAMKIEEGMDALDCETDNFHGKHRKAAKMSIAPGSFKSYDDLPELLGSLSNTNDEYMMTHTLINKGEKNNRVAEEKRNVRIKAALLYAIKREPDNDFHLIIGNGRGVFFNVECTGLPGRNSPDYRRLLTMRNSLESVFGELCQSKYTVYKRGIPISISGSLFYDIDHRPGVVGPEGYRPKTAWEIHPITNLEFTGRQ